MVFERKRFVVKPLPSSGWEESWIFNEFPEGGCQVEAPDGHRYELSASEMRDIRDVLNNLMSVESDTSPED